MIFEAQTILHRPDLNVWRWRHRQGVANIPTAVYFCLYVEEAGRLRTGRCLEFQAQRQWVPISWQLLRQQLLTARVRLS